MFYSWECSIYKIPSDIGVCYCCQRPASFVFDESKKYKCIDSCDASGDENIVGIFILDDDTFEVALEKGTTEVYKLKYDILKDNFGKDVEPHFNKKTLNFHNKTVSYAAPVGFGLKVSVSEDGCVRFKRFDDKKDEYIPVGKGFFGSDNFSSICFSVLRYAVFAYGFGYKVNVVNINENAELNYMQTFSAGCNISFLGSLSDNRIFLCLKGSIEIVNFWKSDGFSDYTYTYTYTYTSFISDGLYCLFFRHRRLFVVF